MSEYILQVNNVSKSFGGVQALKDINIKVKKDVITGIIGPNGAGKSTLFNVIVGIYQPDTGENYLEDQLISDKANYQIHRMGLSRTFQNIRLFDRHTILENVVSGAISNHGKTEEEVFARAKELLEDINLYDQRFDYPQSLDYGSKKRLEIARALMASPKLLMLDEPAAGMNEKETQDLMAYIKKIAEREVTILIIEHDMNMVMNLCQEINVLNFGELIASGSPEEISQNEEVIEAYLGSDYDHADH